jgi:hypothetical protein
MKIEIATYQATPEKHNRGMYFFTSCGHHMYSIKSDDMAYHGCYCPACRYAGIDTLLYLQGSKEAEEYQKGKED